MTAAITGLDHALVGVRDLEAARAIYGRLGFTCTPRGRHLEWGTANYCIMFADDYIELIGIVDPTRFTNRLDVFLAGREGVMAIAFATDDAAAAYGELAAAGVNPEPPSELARDLELPEGTVQPRFRLVHLPGAATPALAAFVCQQLTPETVRRPAWLAHPNGAQGLAAVTTVVAEPAALAEPYARLFGAGAVTPTDTILTVRVGATALVFVKPDEFDLLYGEVDLEPGAAPPLIAGLTVRVADLAATAKALDDGGVAYVRDRTSALVVPPAEACGVMVEFATT